MTPLPPVPNVIKAQILIDDGTDTRAMCISHFQYSGGIPSGADLATLATQFRTACTALDGILTTAQAMESFTLTDLNTNTGAQAVNSTPINGSLSGTGLTGNVAAVMLFHVARRFRGGKYKMFVPGGVTTSLLNNSTWTPTFITAITSAATSWAAAFVGSVGGTTTITHQVGVSYYKGYNPPTTSGSGRVKQTPALRPEGPVVDVVTSWSASARVGSQRKRLYR